MLLVPDRAPLKATLLRALDGFPAVVARPWTTGSVAFGADGQDDALDGRDDPRVDREALRALLARTGVPAVAVPTLSDAIVDRERVLDLGAAKVAPERPLTLFEHAALRDVLGDELIALLPIDDVVIDRAVLRGGLNHCAMEGARARIRLLGTNGTTLAGRTHALVHELGHALVGVARARGRSYRAAYGQSDYGRFLDPRTFDVVCDEEAMVRALADAWLLRRAAVVWSRTWPGAIDDVGKDLDADDLAAFVRFRLAQGLGLPHEPVRVRRGV